MAMPIIHWFYFEKKTSENCHLQSYGIPHLIDIITSSYVNLRCRVRNINIEFDVKKNKTGVREGWVMSPTLNANIWIMKNKTPDIPRNNRWNTFTTLEDIDFAVNIALFSHSYHYIQYKTNILHKYAGSIRLKNQYWKSEVMIPNVNNPTA